MAGETRMEEVLSELLALKRLYGLLHTGQAADENLDETSRALLMRMLDDATQQALLRQAKIISGSLLPSAPERKLSVQPDRRTRDAVPQLGISIKPPVSRSPSLLASEGSRRLKPQSSVRSRDGRRLLSHRREDDERLLGRVTSNRLYSKTAMLGHYPDPEHGLGSHRSSRAAKPQHGTVGGGTHRGERWGASGRGDHSSLERSSRRSSLSGEPPTQARARLHGHATARHDGAEGSSTRRFGRLDTGLSASITASRHGSRRGIAMSERPPSSSHGTVTIRSRIKPSRELMDRCMRRAEEAGGESPRRWRQRKDGAIAGSVDNVGWSSRQRRVLNRIDSGSSYSSDSSGVAVTSFPSMSHTASSSLTPAASTSSSVSRGIDSPPEYAFEASSTLRSRRRRERQERREGLLRRLKNKFVVVFHHHHHLRRLRLGNHHRMSPWRYLGSMLHSSTGHEESKKTTNRTVVSAPDKRRRGGGGHAHALLRHMWGAARRAPTLAGMRRTGSRLQVKKLHWWQMLRRRRRQASTAGSSRTRRRLGQGKKAM